MSAFDFENNSEFYVADTSEDLKKINKEFSVMLRDLSKQHPKNNSSIVLGNAISFNSSEDQHEIFVSLDKHGNRELVSHKSLSFYYKPIGISKTYNDELFDNVIRAFKLHGINKILGNFTINIFSNKFREINLDLSYFDYIGGVEIILSADIPEDSTFDRIVNIKLPKNIQGLNIEDLNYTNEKYDKNVIINLSENKKVKHLKLDRLLYNTQVLPIISSLQSISEIEIIGVKTRKEVMKIIANKLDIEFYAKLSDFTNVKNLSKLMLDVGKLDLSGVTKFNKLTYLGIKTKTFTYNNPNEEDITWFEPNDSRKPTAMFLCIGGLIYNYDDWKDFATAHNRKKSNS